MSRASSESPNIECTEWQANGLAQGEIKVLIGFKVQGVHRIAEGDPV